MAFPQSFVNEVRDRVNLVELVGRRVALKRRGRDHWGCCPFHHEKTPSFKVSEDRDNYKCFGCGAGGSAFDFVMQTEGLSFPEAVEQLAEFVGLAVPETRPEDRERADHLTRLAEANEAAASWFQAQLKAGVGGIARDYIAGRGLSAAAVEEFRLGFAPDRNDGLKQALLARGFSEGELIEAGLIAKPDDGRASYDRFRDRLMFPIADRRGRVIAFGGRALGEARAKYLNSPETPLFNKSKTLYNHAMARGAARDAGTIVVAEGYMDVIALAEAGLRHAVAPLGTAVTDDQIGMLWQMTAEPVMCLDGDTAGLRAAQRAAERALPILKPGKSLRFAMLPEGKDPDDLLRAEGRGALDTVLRGAMTLSALVFRSALSGRPTDTPERRAALEQELTRLAFTIDDETIRKHYLDDLRGRARAHFRPARPGPQRGGNRPGVRWNRPAFENVDPLRAMGRNDPVLRREEAILSALLAYPDCIDRFRNELEELEFRDSDMDRALIVLCEARFDEPDLDSDELKRHFHAAGLHKLAERLSTPAAVGQEESRDEGVTEALARQFQALLLRYRIEALEEELRERAAELKRDPDEDALQRYFAVKQELDRLRALEAQALRGSDDEKKTGS